MKSFLLKIILLSIVSITYVLGNDEELPSPEQLMDGLVFCVKHSQSPNMVIYHSNDKSDHDPIIQAHWLLKNKDNKVEELTRIERKMAFGFRIEHSSSDKTQIRLNAIKDRTIEIVSVSNSNQHKKGVMLINNTPAYLKEVFIDFKHSLLGPKVISIDFFGNSLKDNQSITERICVR